MDRATPRAARLAAPGDQLMAKDPKSECLGTPKKFDFPQKKFGRERVNFALPALPCRTNIVISPKLWPVIA